MIVLIDNYDSFVHNLARYFRRLGMATRVVRHDRATVAEVRAMQPEAVVISPGPYGPSQTGICQQVVRELGGTTPILGVCLGHQVILAAHGGAIRRANRPVHGSASWIDHDGTHEFAGCPCPMAVGRYHSLQADPLSVPDSFEVSAWTSDGLVMAIRHRHQPTYGWQFHPESILTPQGPQLLAGFLRDVGIHVLGAVFTEGLVSAPPPPRDNSDATSPGNPITF